MMAAGGDSDSIHSDMSVPRICIEGTLQGEEPMDSYTAGIELSNACRQFYVTRLKAANQVKQRLGLIESNSSLSTSNNTPSEPSISSTDSLDYVVARDHCGSPDLVPSAGGGTVTHGDPTLSSPASQERVQNLGVSSLSETKQGCPSCSRRSQTGEQPSGNTPGSDEGRGVVCERCRATQHDRNPGPQRDNNFNALKGQGSRWSSVQDSMALLKREMVSECFYYSTLQCKILSHATYEGLQVNRVM